MYDGDIKDPDPDIGHPWHSCTANFAQLYYKTALKIKSVGQINITSTSKLFFEQIGVNDNGEIDSNNGNFQPILDKMVEAGDRMLKAIIYHSNYLELSEQVDRETGFEKSVRNLTWSYAAFLSAVRARREFYYV
jgi:glucoamylase